MPKPGDGRGSLPDAAGAPFPRRRRAWQRALLARGWAETDRDRQALLALRGGLALASCLADAEQSERARQVLAEAWRLYSRVSDAAEMLRVYAPGSVRAMCLRP